MISPPPWSAPWWRTSKLSARKRTRRPKTAHLILGPDAYLRNQYREKLIAENVPAEVRAFAVARFPLKRSSLDEVLSQARILPMLSPRQVMIVTEAEALTETEVSALEEYLEDPVESTILVFEAEKLDGRTRVARLLQDRCEVHEAESPEGAAAQERVARSMAKELGVRLDQEAVEELVFAVGDDQGTLHAELEKLRAYAGPGTQVTSVDVSAVVVPARKFDIFDLPDLLAERRRAEALARLHRLLEAGENAIGIVGLLAWLYRQLLIAQGLPTNMPSWKAARALRAPRSRIESLLRQARRFSRRELSDGLGALQQADVDLKSSPPNPAAVLEMLVVRLTEAPARSGRVAS